ncbi:DUF6434 domain-containing protein [Sanguibacter gelidistatuariae]|uniref:DUF6434 domain-containing protein n=1 Tax=Sanguibacter gelidistatuariae TaxID=1814289 RepID=UPI001C312677|nr:DUF6434 domain-containing protein [Sanguibacter gelidistatuariae]
MSGKQLTGLLSEHTVIPPGQRSSQVLRAWFSDRLGPTFHFDSHMRDFIAAADGSTTLADALDLWRSTRDAAPKDIDPQFELNRFTRDWHSKNPGGTRADMLTAWTRHRSLPTDRRDRI